MKYDPIKRSLGKVFNNSPLLRKIFYSLLDILLLRAWHIKSEIGKWNIKSNTDKKILDAGAGFGQYTWYMSKLGKKYNIDAVDVKDEQIEDCNKFFEQINKTNQVKFFKADLREYSLENTYDFILSVDVMEHIEEDEQVFKNFYHSMKINGMLLISTPSDQGGSDVHDHDHEDSFIEEHVREGYNINDIQEKLKSVGFEQTSARYSYGCYGQISWKLSMKYPIMILNISKLFFIILPIYYIITFPFSILFNFIDLKSNPKTGTGLIVKAWKK